jgi:6-phosphogluconolactonase
MSAIVVVHPDRAALHADAAARFIAAASRAAAVDRPFDVLLTGGSTAPAVYRRLAAEPCRARVDWNAIRVWWTDERCVPVGDPRSNYDAAREALLDRVPIPCERIHRMRGEDLNREREAVRYEAALRREQGLERGAPPGFDFAFLGLGSDAHVASLFPGAPTLTLTDRLVAAVSPEEVRIPDPSVGRITLTVPALAGAREAVFVVAGAEKADAVRAVLEEPRRPTLRPAQGIDPDTSVWLLDEPAAARLSLPVRAGRGI